MLMVCKPKYTAHTINHKIGKKKKKLSESVE